MKKTLCTTLVLILLMFSASVALAAIEGTYDWEGDTIAITVNEKPMFAPADMTDEQRPIALEITVSGDFMADEANHKALYQQAAIVDANGNVYRPGAATSKDEEPQLNYLYAIPKDVEIDALALEFKMPTTASEVPEEYIGKWAGNNGSISLTFEIDADGKARFSFEQGGYSESNELALSVEDGTFSVEIEEDDTTTETCGGSYSYADSILTINVEILFKNGRTFAYTVDCERVEE